MARAKAPSIDQDISGYAPGVGLTAFFFVVEGVVALLSVISEVLSAFVLDSCAGGGCHYALSTVAWYTMPIAAVLILVLTGILVSVYRSSERRSWWIPLSGTFAIVLVFLITQWLVAAAVNQLPPGLDPSTYFGSH